MDLLTNVSSPRRAIRVYEAYPFDAIMGYLERDKDVDVELSGILVPTMVK